MHTRRLALVSSEAEEKKYGPSLRVAIATHDGKAVNAHFGSASRFVVYEISSEHSTFIATVTFDDVSDESGHHSTERDDRNGAKIQALEGIQLLVVQAIGAPVAARVVRAGIYPIKMAGEETTSHVLNSLQELLRGEPPPWLRRILLVGQQRNMDYLDED